MTWRLAQLLESGELDNTQRDWTIGWLQLHGFTERLQLKLAGNCHPDLAGWKFRIHRIEPECSGDDSLGDEDAPGDISTISQDQISTISQDQSGRVGDITADHMVKHHDIPNDELARRLIAGEKPPYKWSKCFYMEWFSNVNGRMVIESTRLEVERLGERAFELTDEEWKEQARYNREELIYFMTRMSDALRTDKPDEES